MSVEDLNDFHKQRQVDLSRRLRQNLEDSENTKRAEIGLVQWFWPGEQDRVEMTIADMHSLGIRHLRTGLSWADWCTDEGKEWYQWLFPRLAKDVELFPCFTYTPPSFGIVPKTSSPPRDSNIFGGFIDEMITFFGDHFEWLQLWNEPNNSSGWDFTLDQGWVTFSMMVGGAANWAKTRGKKTVLGGISPIDPNWLRLESFRAMIPYFDAIAIHGFPGTWDYLWDGWTANVGRIREVLDYFGSNAEIWVTEVGYSTWRHDERKQVQEFLDAIEAPVERVYWYSVLDLNPELPTVDGFHSDEREYHFGLKRTDGTPKLLYRVWTERGLEGIREKDWLATPVYLHHEEKNVLITGGAGFIGTNLAAHLLEQGKRVVLFDNLSRLGTEHNWRMLQEKYCDRVRIEVCDVRDQFALRGAIERASQVYHLAAQVEVASRIKGPLHDFEVNVRGTINLLEAIRSLDEPPPLIYASSDSVYGSLADLPVRKDGTRYELEDPSEFAAGISEDFPLCFHDLNGCSKGAADQYVMEYAYVYGLTAVVLRIGSVYGPHQSTNDDAAWLKHMMMDAAEDRPVTIYGDGMQVRDLLYVDDLVEAFLIAQEKIANLSGQAFNIGGGLSNSTSPLELLGILENLLDKQLAVRSVPPCPGERNYFITDTRKFKDAAGWSPRVDVKEGLRRTLGWLIENRQEPSYSALDTAHSAT